MTGAIPAVKPKEQAQTLSRGIELLEILSDAPGSLSLAELIARSGLARTIVYRLLCTLVDRGVVRVRHDRRYELSFGLFILGQRSVGLAIGSIVRPLLDRTADEHGCAAVLSVIHDDGVLALVTAETPRSRVQAHHREGMILPLGMGASGIAALAALPPTPGERSSVTRARRIGFAVSHAAVAANTVAAAAPVSLADPGLVGTVTFLFPDSDAPDVMAAGALVRETAAEIGRLFESVPR